MTLTQTDTVVASVLAALTAVGITLLYSLWPQDGLIGVDGEIYNLDYEIVTLNDEVYDTPETEKVYRLMWAEKRGPDLQCMAVLEEVQGDTLYNYPSAMSGFENNSMQTVVLSADGEASHLRAFDSEFICPDL